MPSERILLLGVPGEILIFVTLAAWKRSGELKPKDLLPQGALSAAHQGKEQTVASHCKK